VTERGHEVHVYGVPGAGKTTWVKAKVEATARARGADKIVEQQSPSTAPTATPSPPAITPSPNEG
jgi:ABC-type Mn2+/Zn2+ transport system ATPase subunit